MTDDFKVSGIQVAWVLWVVGLALILVGFLTATETGQLGLFTTGAAMTLHIRGTLCVMHQREKAAFNLGAESARLHSLP